MSPASRPNQGLQTWFCRSFNQLKHIHKLLLLICLEMLIETTSCLLGHDDLCVYFTPFLLILSVICIYLDM
ncbi:hypothetical protein ABFX02_05G097700 [Erythranthe guttata]